MNLSTFVPYVPFLAILYALFALLQVLRHKQQGIGATVLALIAVVAPVLAYILSSDATIHASLLQYILINAGVVFVASLLTLLIERRNPSRDNRHSYGMFGIGVSMILVAAMFALPLLITSSASASSAAATTTTTTTNSSDNGQIVLASDRTSVNPFSQTTTTTDTAQAQSTESADQTSTVPSGNFAPPNGAPQAQATEVAAPQATATEIPATATEIPTAEATIAKPTPIVFPTNTPASESTDEAVATDEATAAADVQAVSNAATCTLVVDYNLNLRNQPTTDGSTVLVSIPYGTTVTTDGKTADGWYRVSYNDQSGWVTGQYVTATASCSSLTTVSAS